MIRYNGNGGIATSDVTIIRGCDFSLGRFSKRQRGQLAVEVVEGRAIINELSKKLLARLFGVRASYLRAFLDGSRHGDGLLDTKLKLDCCLSP